jgi:hypothetical protein
MTALYPDPQWGKSGAVQPFMGDSLMRHMFEINVD